MDHKLRNKVCHELFCHRQEWTVNSFTVKDLIISTKFDQYMADSFFYDECNFRVFSSISKTFINIVFDYNY